MSRLGNETFYQRYGKRVIDLCLSLVLLILFWWVLAIVAILVRVKLGSPVLFRQPRPGRDEKVFNLYKFRTMTDERDADGNLLPDEQRLTKFGSVLRSTSLDELPEVFNIVRGDMSIIGPRPLLVKYLPRYSAEQRRRHEARPGLTGLAQVNGRNSISWDEKFLYDVEYVDNVSLGLDASIFLRTILATLRRSGISAEGEATMPEFMGDESKETRDAC
ncbi:sugar transferase [Collinsella sp. AM28-11LB]|uniref:sugar transferase n=1 Tax=Collinsella sp. AM28-11LB TaxID=2292312 RepID=UPI000E4A55C8|nr:sugar transferase [Collinsella sp. AM28-11LB]RHE52757.1 sugar transferase [Collinsella sp. AM28-11LB]